MKNAIAVTGIGCLTPCGNDVRETWQSLIDGVSGIGPIRRFDTSEHKVHIAGEVRDFDPEALGLCRKEQRLDPFAQYALVAAEEALRDSGLLETASASPVSRETLGVAIGTGMGGLGCIEEQQTVLLEKGANRVSALLAPSGVPDVASTQIALRHGFRGPTFAVVTACSSGTDALIQAARCILDGSATCMIAGGAEATVTPLAIASFANLRALSTSARDPAEVSRPFDAERDGFVMGEGAGALVLESLEHAAARGARIHAVLAGYGQTTDAHHATAPDPSGEGAARAMRLALTMAGVDAGDTVYLNAHGTSTPPNDPMETRAIKAAFGEERAREIAISSSKSMTGHLIGAAGAVEAIVAIQALETGHLPPTINLDSPDPECDLDYVPNRARKAAVTVAMSNTFGFGGHNSSVVFRKPP